MHLDEVCRRTDQSGWGGRVAIGHVSKLSALDADALQSVGRRLAGAGVAVYCPAATDLYLMGRGAAHSVPRGVAPATSPARPRGDLFAVDQQRPQSVHAVRRLLADPDGKPLRQCRTGGTTRRVDGVPRHGDDAVGPPDESVATTASPSAIPPTSSCSIALTQVRRWRKLAQPLLAMKRGRISFSRAPAVINWPTTANPSGSIDPAGPTCRRPNLIAAAATGSAASPLTWAEILISYMQ